MSTQKTTFVILGILTIEPMSGYDIKKMIDESVRHFWAESNGQLYPTLNKLVQSDCVTVTQEQTGRKIRHIYEITEKGRRLLQEWLAEKSENKSVHRDEELLKLFFGSNVGNAVTIELLQQRLERTKVQLQKYHEIEKELTQKALDPKQLYWMMTLSNGIHHAEAEIQWCNESIEKIQKGKAQ